MKVSKVSKLDDFLRLAENKVGDSGSWSWGSCYTNVNDPWSAKFVSACAKKLNLENVIPITSLAQDIADVGTSKEIRHPGKWIPGTAQGGSGIPKSGDIVLFNWDSKGSARADSVGIVKNYSKNTNHIVVISGDTRKAGEYRSVVGMNTYNIDNNCIKGYFRPDWESLD